MAPPDGTAVPRAPVLVVFVRIRGERRAFKRQGLGRPVYAIHETFFEDFREFLFQEVLYGVFLCLGAGRSKSLADVISATEGMTSLDALMSAYFSDCGHSAADGVLRTGVAVAAAGGTECKRGEVTILGGTTAEGLLLGFDGKREKLGRCCPDCGNSEAFLGRLPLSTLGELAGKRALFWELLAEPARSTKVLTIKQ